MSRAEVVKHIAKQTGLSASMVRRGLRRGVQAQVVGSRPFTVLEMDGRFFYIQPRKHS